jgi:hypothetical protein
MTHTVVTVEAAITVRVAVNVLTLSQKVRGTGMALLFNVERCYNRLPQEKTSPKQDHRCRKQHRARSDLFVFCTTQKLELSVIV